ncbi:MAG: PleD family two-component system response regulator [Pseudomonadota bacterium]|nr:PleD family two-component system response regulator [Pseudomonadota bacterium]
MSGRILVVDDFLPNVKLLVAKLSSEYFDVITAQSGQEAIDKIKVEVPDLVLLDVMMPGMDGFECCKLIKADPATRHIPIVMVTALSDNLNKVKGLESGADDFLTKPVNDVALFARVRSLVRLKLMIDQWRLRENTSEQLGVLGQAAIPTDESTEKADVLVLTESRIEAGKIADTLSEDKGNIIAVDRASAALESAINKDFDLILISLSLRESDPLRMASQLRSHEATRQVPILMIGEEPDMDRIARGLELGCNDYLIRPIDRNELLARSRTQIQRKRYQERLRTNYEASLSMALTDSLTGLFNRRYLNAHIERTLRRSIENNRAVSVLMLDIDFFKTVNDTYGHDIGDEVLKELARRIGNNMRTSDLVARYGGEEFVVILPDTNRDSALAIAERLRCSIADVPFQISADVSSLDLTISIGVAEAASNGVTGLKVLKRADQALYDAKHAGRNRVMSRGKNSDEQAPTQTEGDELPADQS